MRTCKSQACALLAFLMLLLAGCQQEGVTAEEHQNYMWRKESHAHSWKFQMKLDRDPSGVGLCWPTGDERDKYADVVFVGDKEEGFRYSGDALVCWPSDDTRRLVWRVNRHVVSVARSGYPPDEPFDFASFGLAYPLTVEDVVERWEAVEGFMDSFDTASTLRVRRDSLLARPEWGYLEGENGWYPLPTALPSPSPRTASASPSAPR